jgi:hypothetical protein
MKMKEKKEVCKLSFVEHERRDLKQREIFSHLDLLFLIPPTFVSSSLFFVDISPLSTHQSTVA